MDDSSVLNNEPGQPSNPAVARLIRWTTKEAMACAYCWAEFVHPERHMPGDAPETYWLRISERALIGQRTQPRRRGRENRPHEV
jgi:hypothetical protein